MKTTDLAAKRPCCQGPPGGAVDQLEQSRAWPEIGNALGGNLNLAAGLWIASCVLGADGWQRRRTVRFGLDHPRALHGGYFLRRSPRQQSLLGVRFQGLATLLRFWSVFAQTSIAAPVEPSPLQVLLEPDRRFQQRSGSPRSRFSYTCSNSPAQALSRRQRNPHLARRDPDPRSDLQQAQTDRSRLRPRHLRPHPVGVGAGFEPTRIGTQPPK